MTRDDQLDALVLKLKRQRRQLKKKAAEIEKLNYIIDRLYEDHPCCNPDRG